MFGGSSAGTYVKYLYTLALVLILVVYWEGAYNLAKVGVAGVIGLDYAATGRTQQGQFAGYPVAA